MVFLNSDRFNPGLIARFARREFAPNRYDLVAFALIGALAVVVVHGAQQMNMPVAALHAAPVVLDPMRLPEYAIRSTLRMFAAIILSLLFTFVVATLAAKSRKAGMVIVPMLDILQSIPIMTFLAFTTAFFIGLFPRSEMGSECAAIFGIFTSQVWNMTFSFYQSMRTLPADLEEVSTQFNLSPWQRFIKLELPFATPALVWNTMMSMSGSWFFVVASEALTVGTRSINLPGIGTWLALAIEHSDARSVLWAVFAMAVVILLYDQLLFRPIVAWADKFRFELTASEQEPQSWFLDLLQRTRLFPRIARPIGRLLAAIPRPPRLKSPVRPITDPTFIRWFDRLWIAVVAIGAISAAATVAIYVHHTLVLKDVLYAAGLGFLTFARVLVLIIVASAIWVPIGVWIGLRPAWSQRIQPVAQFLAAFPVNILFPFVVLTIVAGRLDPNVWLSPLIILGTQWYILFNVVAGASVLPTDLKEAAGIFKLRSWQRWRDLILPGIFPYYVTGALTASGGSWNASIVAEYVSWGHTKLHAAGLGSYIAMATEAGDFPRIALGSTVISMFVLAMNHTLWRPMYRYAEKNLRLN